MVVSLNAPIELTREEVLGGLPARRASMLLFAIERRTARLVARSRTAIARHLPERTAAERERAFLDALAMGRDSPVRPKIQDLERYAPVWASLVPDDPTVRAALARMMGDQYPLDERQMRGMRRALGLDDGPVREAFERLYHEPLASIYAAGLPRLERGRWLRSRFAHRLETLRPFWTTFALTLTETIGAGILALPIALAEVGPIAGVVVLLVLGLVNIVTIAAIAEAVARNGNVRYGHAYFGRLVDDYLGSAAAWILKPAFLAFSVVVLLAYYVGLSTTLSEATGVPNAVWSAMMFLLALFFLRRESLDATVASALVVGAASIGLILLLFLITLPSITVDNLRHATAPFVNG